MREFLAWITVVGAPCRANRPLEAGRGGRLAPIPSRPEGDLTVSECAHSLTVRSPSGRDGMGARRPPLPASKGRFARQGAPTTVIQARNSLMIPSKPWSAEGNGVAVEHPCGLYKPIPGI